MFKKIEQLLIKLGLITPKITIEEQPIIEEQQVIAKSELNQVTVKSAKAIGKETETPKPKKKRKYKKKPTKITDNKSEVKKTEKDVTTKTTNRKPRKTDPSV